MDAKLAPPAVAVGGSPLYARCVVYSLPRPQGATMEEKPRLAGSLEHGEGGGEESTAVGSK